MTEGPAVAMLSLHTSPLAQPGVGDGGGMNVYVRELTGALAQSGVDCRVFVRVPERRGRRVVEVEPGFRVVDVPCGGEDVQKEDLPELLPEITSAIVAELEEEPADLIHAHYWMSGLVGHRLKHQLEIPLVVTYHTLARVKRLAGEHESQLREVSESQIASCAEKLVVASPMEREDLVWACDVDPGRVEVVPPGVDHALFSPGDRWWARRALNLGEGRVLLFVGRIQPLKGLDLAVKTLIALDDPDARLVVVGGPSGPRGIEAMEEAKRIAEAARIQEQVVFVDPQPHHLLSTYYRASDVVVVPSHTESFGLVGLEAAACGIPVVASDVGGLRSVVLDGETGILVSERDPLVWAERVDWILSNPERRAAMSQAASSHASGFRWSVTAGRLRRLYGDVASRAPTPC
ncbi:MAG: D-inositol 3-phosphate glycosyltransferase [Acidimicrobiales bacterium]|nr:MAG: D-inositol 3-phosphate glycosyltransferase [Acidimicrobiales bacterium]